MFAGGQHQSESKESVMNRFTKYVAPVVLCLATGLTASAQSGRGQSAIDVNNSGNGQDNHITVDPRTGQNVFINRSGNGSSNTITVAPDPHGTVFINASGNGRGNKIVVDEAPGEHVVIRGSANGKNNDIDIVKVPGPTNRQHSRGRNENDPTRKVARR
jgi:hypothetical protein